MYLFPNILGVSEPAQSCFPIFLSSALVKWISNTSLSLIGSQEVLKLYSAVYRFLSKVLTDKQVVASWCQPFFYALRVEWPPLHHLNPSETVQVKLKVDPPTQIRTGHTGHLITSDTSFQPVPISCCDFGRQLQMCSCQFAPYWRTLRQGLEVSHFTNCILSPFVRRQECSDGFYHH